MIAVTDGDTYNYSVELLEAKFPLLIRRYQYNVESRRRRRTAIAADLVWCASTRSKATTSFCTPATAAPRRRRGRVDGGCAGSLNGIEVVRGKARQWLTRPPDFPLQRGDRVRIMHGRWRRLG